MEPATLSVMTWIGGAIVTGVLTFIGWAARQKWNQVDYHEAEISDNKVRFEHVEKELKRLEDNMLTIEQVQEVFDRSNKPIETRLLEVSGDISANTTAMHTVLLQLSERKGYEKAMRENRDDHK